MPAKDSITRFQTQRRVRTVDTDFSGTVHVSAYIRMMEETEYAFLRSRGLSVVLSDQRGVLGFPRLEARIDLLSSSSFDEELQIELSLMEVDGKHIVYDFTIECINGMNVGQKVATGSFRVVCCRFPPGEPPRAILTPHNVMDALMN